MYAVREIGFQWLLFLVFLSDPKLRLFLTVENPSYGRRAHINDSSRILLALSILQKSYNYCTIVKPFKPFYMYKSAIKRVLN